MLLVLSRQTEAETEAAEVEATTSSTAISWPLPLTVVPWEGADNRRSVRLVLDYDAYAAACQDTPPPPAPVRGKKGSG